MRVAAPARRRCSRYGYGEHRVLELPKRSQSETAILDLLDVPDNGQPRSRHDAGDPVDDAFGEKTSPIDIWVPCRCFDAGEVVDARTENVALLFPFRRERIRRWQAPELRVTGTKGLVRRHPEVHEVCAPGRLGLSLTLERGDGGCIGAPDGRRCNGTGDHLQRLRAGHDLG